MDLLADAGITPAELHGGICGAASVGGLPAAHAWLAGCRARSARTEEDAAVSAALGSLASATLERLESGEMTFAPLLPDDEEALAERVEALASWCHGFLAGFAAVEHAPRLDALAPPLDEIVDDFAELSRAALGESGRGAPRQSEFDFIELTEYVRVGAQLAFEELRELRASALAGKEHE